MASSTRDPRRPDMESETFEALGRMTAAFGQMEVWVTFLLHELLGSSDLGLALYEKAHFSQKLRICRTLVDLRVKDEARRADFKALLDRVDAASSMRNDYAHSMWATDPATVDTPMPKAIRINVQKSPRTRDGDLTALRQFVMELADLSDEVRALMPRIAKEGFIPEGTLFHL